MQGYGRILVPLDFAGLSEATLQAASRVAASGARLTLLHVVEWLPSVTGGAFGIYPHRKDIEQLMALSRERLAEMGQRLEGLDVAIDVREGRAAASILEAVAELRPDLVVIGSHGRSGLDHLLLGSVTERVLRKATLPVLVVRCPPATDES